MMRLSILIKENQSIGSKTPVARKRRRIQTLHLQARSGIKVMTGNEPKAGWNSAGKTKWLTAISIMAKAMDSQMLKVKALQKNREAKEVAVSYQVKRR
jgi:recombinational DNA repair ATPase RecF